jgi:hypothetical protein
MMKSRVAVLVSSLVIPAIAMGGAAPSHISCKSTDPKKEQVILEGVWGPEFNLTLGVGPSKLSMTDKDSEAHAMEAVKDSVLSLVIARTDKRPLLLYALPKTVKAKTGVNFAHAEFVGILQQAPKPGFVGPISAHAFIWDVRMSCVYDWKL